MQPTGRHWPFNWREPLPSRKRCPKCSGRMRCGPSQCECVYCGYVEREAPIIRRSPPGQFGDTPGGLEYRVEESIAKATGERVGEQFVSYELPRYNNAERTCCVGFLALLVFLHIPFSGRRSRGPDIWDFASEPDKVYILLVTLLAALICGLAAYATFPWLRRFAIAVAALAGVLCGLDDLHLLPFGARSPLSMLVFPTYANIIVGLQSLAYLWSAWFIHRDTRELLES